MRGGAEYLVDGLRAALQAQGYLVDVIQLPFSWHPAPRVLESALAWRLVNVMEVNEEPVDQVICTKFPSYLVRHPRKVIWLVHQFRQAYDWYGTPLSDLTNTPEDRAVREAIFRMDQRAMREAVACYAISRNVSQRLQYFNGFPSTPLYPPSRYAEQLRIGPYGDYILSPTRLDAAKRVDLLLRAMAHTNERVRAIVTGRGPEQARLEQLAATLGLGERVRFAGFVDDATLVDLYAGARAVYYAPIDEDYGFATVEAFGSARPVITTSDAGGVLEFVEHGVNGYIASPEPRAIAPYLERLMDDVELAAHLGQAGLLRVRDISWQRVLNALLLPR